MHTHAYRRDWQAHLQPPPHPMSIQPGHELVRARMHVGNELKRWLGEEHIDPVAMDDTRGAVVQLEARGDGRRTQCSGPGGPLFRQAT
eukprot:scaffold4414_cov25-Tisochrysis_lutea.AAC.1